MAFTGFNFRATLLGGTGFLGDGANTFVATTQAYSSGGFGYKSTQPAGVNTNNTKDARLAGVHNITTTNIVFQVDVPNGTYDVRIAAAAAGSAVQQNLRITFGTGPNDFVEITSNVSGTASTVPNGSEMDATGAILTDDSWAGSTPGQGTTRVTVKNGFLQISRVAAGSNYLYLRHFAYQVVPGALQGCTLDTNDTGAIVNTTGTTTAGSPNVALPLPIGICAPPPVGGQGMIATGPALPAGGVAVASVSGSVATTGDTAAGSAVVQNLPSVPNIYVGMAVTGPALYVSQLYTVTAVTLDGNGNTTSATLSTSSGITAATGGALNFFGTGANGVTLASGSGIQAATNTPIRFAYKPQLYEKEAVGKLVCPITFFAGATNAVTIMNAAGTAPDPYLGVTLADPAGTGYLTPYLTVIAAGFPGTSSSYTFQIWQADSSGNFTGSPFKTTFSLPVVFAPTKPTSGRYSPLSSGAWVMREAFIAKFLSGKWQGYKGPFDGTQNITSIPAGNIAKVSSLAQWKSQMDTFAAQAGPGQFFAILCDGSAGNDWSTSQTYTGSSWDFQPENGGGLVVGPLFGAAPLIYANLDTGNQRGVEWRGLTWPGNGSRGNVPFQGNCFRIDYNANARPSVVLFRYCKFGALYDPGTTDAALAAKTGTFNGVNQYTGVLGIKILRGADQLTVLNCDFWGCSDAIQTTSVRILESGWNTFRRIYGDCHAPSMVEVNTPLPFKIPATGAAASDQECINYVHDNASWLCMDNPSSYPTNLASAVPHPDFFQIRNPATAGANQGPCALLLENNVSLSNATNCNQDASGNRYSLARQFLQGGNDQTTTPIRAVIFNNIGATLQVRGLDMFGVVDGYAEYNSLVGAASMPDSNTQTKFVCVPEILSDLSLRRYPGQKRTRKNVLAKALTLGTQYCLYGEQNTTLTWDGNGPMPGTIFVGTTFGAGLNSQGQSDVSNRIAYPFPADSASSSGNDIRKAIWALFKPLIDGGAQQMGIRLNPGDADALTPIQAASLVAVTEAQPVGALPGAVSLRWNSGAGGTGNQVGADVALSVQ